MSYTALYRKFRPVEFEDVKGQEHIITTLKNQIEANLSLIHIWILCLYTLRQWRSCLKSRAEESEIFPTISVQRGIMKEYF